jgi:hypothetical protein
VQVQPQALDAGVVQTRFDVFIQPGGIGQPVGFQYQRDLGTALYEIGQRKAVTARQAVEQGVQRRGDAGAVHRAVGYGDDLIAEIHADLPGTVAPFALQAYSIAVSPSRFAADSLQRPDTLRPVGKLFQQPGPFAAFALARRQSAVRAARTAALAAGVQWGTCSHVHGVSLYGISYGLTPSAL